MDKDKKNKQKELILRVLTDPKFKRLLVQDPTKALNVEKITPEIKKEINVVLAVVKGIESQISNLADELLCANGGPCGIA